MTFVARNNSPARRCAIVTARERGRLLSRVASRLESGGVHVEFLSTPVEEETRDFHLLVMRAKSPDVTAWARQRQRGGAIVVPDPTTVDIIKDRWTCRHLLMRAGLRLPDAALGKPEELKTSGLRQLLPLVLKHRCTHGLPVRLIGSAEDLDVELNSRPAEDELVAERFIPGVHFTACFIGAQIFCFLAQPLGHGVTSAEPLSSPPAEVLRCVDLYRASSSLYFGKIDVVMADRNEVFVVDSGVSPNLWQIPGADELLSRYFLSLLNHETGGAERPDRNERD